jgi:hypothetical protein
MVVRRRHDAARERIAMPPAAIWTTCSK